MSEPATRARTTLELELGAKSPIGTIAADGGGNHAFSGWVEFVSAIEAWRAEASRASERHDLNAIQSDGEQPVTQERGGT